MGYKGKDVANWPRGIFKKPFIMDKMDTSQLRLKKSDLEVLDRFLFSQEQTYIVSVG